MLIFLDIDGVMVPAKSWKRPEFLNDGFPAFSGMASSVLRHLISEDTTILLTTSHKSKYSIEEWKGIFANRGIKVKKLKALDENTKLLNRKDEVLNWFNTNEVNENFVIIDDDKSLNSLPSSLKKHFVLTSSTIGLTDKHLEEINKILNRDLEFAS